MQALKIAWLVDLTHDVDQQQRIFSALGTLSACNVWRVQLFAFQKLLADLPTVAEIDFADWKQRTCWFD